jgi:SulP family sulfate permease
LVAGGLAGVILLGMGALKVGRLIEYIPHPVTTGFTAGIAVVIATIQLKDVLGLQLAHAPDSYVERWRLMWQAHASFHPAELAVGAATLLLLLGLPRLLPRLPAPLCALALVSITTALLPRVLPGFHVDTIGSRFHLVIAGREVHGIPPLPPMPMLPWRMPGPDGRPLHLDFATIQALLPPAFSIAMLGAIESLLAAVVSDGMSGTKHDSDAELLALGIGNLLCPFFGGIAATGALARTATNIRAGARSPLASAIHALFVLACTVALAPLVAYLPMAALGGLLLLVAKNMAEVRAFTHIVRVAPRSDVIVLLVCFFLTVFFDMVIAVSIGVVLAALLFMRRMAELTDVKLDTGTMARLELPRGVRLYQIAGPLFFGAAQKAMSVLESIRDRSLAIILSLELVPTMDATGLVAFETMIAKLKRSGHTVILSGLNPQPAEVLARAGIVPERDGLIIAPDLDTALSLAILHAAACSGHAQPATAAG